MNDKPIVIEKLFNAPPEKVWKALTDRTEMKKWYFDLEEFRPEKGFSFSFMGGPSPEKQYKHVCEVTAVIPKKILTYSWRYDGYEGVSYVTFDLTDRGEKTLLKLTHNGIETFPQENPDFAIKNFEQGWNEIINTSLNNYLGLSQKQPG